MQVASDMFFFTSFVVAHSWPYFFCPSWLHIVGLVSGYLVQWKPFYIANTATAVPDMEKDPNGANGIMYKSLRKFILEVKCLRTFLIYVKQWELWWIKCNQYFENMIFTSGSGVLPLGQHSWNISVTKEARHSGFRNTKSRTQICWEIQLTTLWRCEEEEKNSRAQTKPSFFFFFFFLIFHL